MLLIEELCKDRIKYKTTNKRLKLSFNAYVFAPILAVYSGNEFFKLLHFVFLIVSIIIHFSELELAVINTQTNYNIP